MEIRYYRDPETGLPHIYGHGVTEGEAEWILAHPAKTMPARATHDRRLGKPRKDAICA